jgi:hypothetical protein
LQTRVLEENALALFAIDEKERGPLLEEAAAFAIHKAAYGLHAHGCGGDACDERLSQMESGCCAHRYNRCDEQR